MSDTHIFVIPARGGSKRLPRKNLKTLWGKPLLMHTIDAALSAEVGGRRIVCVSSEDAEILDLARTVAGVCAIERPFELAEDHVPTHAVLKHAVVEAEAAEGIHADIVWWMNVSVPQVTAHDLEHGYQFLTQNELREVTTVNEEGLAYAAVRLMRRSALFADALSTHFGVVSRSYIDVHSQADLDELQRLGG